MSLEKVCFIGPLPRLAKDLYSHAQGYTFPFVIVCGSSWSFCDNANDLKEKVKVGRDKEGILRCDRIIIASLPEYPLSSFVCLLVDDPEIRKILFKQGNSVYISGDITPEIAEKFLGLGIEGCYVFDDRLSLKQLGMFPDDSSLSPRPKLLRWVVGQQGSQQSQPETLPKSSSLEIYSSPAVSRKSSYFTASNIGFFVSAGTAVTVSGLIAMGTLSLANPFVMAAVASSALIALVILLAKLVGSCQKSPEQELSLVSLN